jgi:hypothetical protein
MHKYQAIFCHQFLDENWLKTVTHPTGIETSMAWARKSASALRVRSLKPGCAQARCCKTDFCCYCSEARRRVKDSAAAPVTYPFCF